jgi:Probable N6-adenine methyltransferase
MTANVDVMADRFGQACASRIAEAATLVGLTRGATPTDEQLAHLAWHVAAIEPSELRHLNKHAPLTGGQATCLETHRQAPDDLEEILPLPHPLDYEWRFDPATRLMLAQRCEQLAGSCGRIALLGTPTLACALRDCGRDVLLLDANAHLLAALAKSGQLQGIQFAAANVATFTIPQEWRHRAAVVVCDPPWYPEGFATFLDVAAQLVRPGGTVLLSMPDLITRPSLADELDDLRRLAAQLLLALEATEVCATRYRTPFFEYRALRSAGVGLVPFDWRAGTLWQFTSTGAVLTTSHGRPGAPAVSPALIEIAMHGVRIRVLRRPAVPSGTLAFHPLVPGDTMPTVSRRHPARASVNLWTSGNTVLNCADPELTGHLLRHLAEANGYALPENLCQLAHDFATQYNLPAGDVRRALDKIGAVVASEYADYAAYRAATR